MREGACGPWLSIPPQVRPPWLGVTILRSGCVAYYDGLALARHLPLACWLGTAEFPPCHELASWPGPPLTGCRRCLRCASTVDWAEGGATCMMTTVSRQCRGTPFNRPSPLEPSLAPS